MTSLLAAGLLDELRELGQRRGKRLPRRSPVGPELLAEVAVVEVAQALPGHGPEVEVVASPELSWSRMSPLCVCVLQGPEPVVESVNVDMPESCAPGTATERRALDPIWSKLWVIQVDPLTIGTIMACSSKGKVEVRPAPARRTSLRIAGAVPSREDDIHREAATAAVAAGLSIALVRAEARAELWAKVRLPAAIAAM